MPSEASSSMARLASTIGVASGYITKAKVLRAGSRIMSMTPANRAFATSSAASPSTDAKTLTSSWRLQSIGSSSSRNVWPVGAVSKMVTSNVSRLASSMNWSNAAISSVHGESSSSRIAAIDWGLRPRATASSMMRSV